MRAFAIANQARACRTHCVSPDESFAARLVTVHTDSAQQAATKYVPASIRKHVLIPAHVSFLLFRMAQKDI